MCDQGLGVAVELIHVVDEVVKDVEVVMFVMIDVVDVVERLITLVEVPV